MPDTQHVSGLLMTAASESADQYNRQSPRQSSARKLIIIAFSHFHYDPVIYYLVSIQEAGLPKNCAGFELCHFITGGC